jgi:chemotaxis protein MotB
MKLFTKQSAALLMALFALSSCVTQKKYAALQANYDKVTNDLRGCNEQKDLCNSNLSNCRTSLGDKQDQYNQLKDQLADCQTQRNKQLTQVGDLTVLSQQANENINKTLAQMQDKDKYIRLLLEAKSKADSKMMK